MAALPGEQGAPGSPVIAEISDTFRFVRDGDNTTRVVTPTELLNRTWAWSPRLDSSPLLDSVEQPQHGLPEPILSEWDRIQSMRISTVSEGTNNGMTGPLQFIRKLLDYWNLELIDAVGLLGLDRLDTDHICRAIYGKGLIRGRDVADRIAHLVSIRATLWSLFRDLQVENEWLRERHETLANKSPLSLLLGGSMEDLLIVREYVDAAAGR